MRQDRCSVISAVYHSVHTVPHCWLLWLVQTSPHHTSLPSGVQIQKPFLLLSVSIHSAHPRCARIKYFSQMDIKYFLWPETELCQWYNRQLINQFLSSLPSIQGNQIAVSVLDVCLAWNCQYFSINVHIFLFFCLHLQLQPGLQYCVIHLCNVNPSLYEGF